MFVVALSSDENRLKFARNQVYFERFFIVSWVLSGALIILTLVAYIATGALGTLVSYFLIFITQTGLSIALLIVANVYLKRIQKN